MLMLPDIMVTVAGHMDGAEAARGLDGLDQRRAEAVAALVEARRLPTATISITAHGATLPLLAGHARAAQNRRVEVRLAFAPLREPTPPAGWRPGG
jgi:outer membrane protein OmpA-like peptidoglycan-associated protein